MYSKKCKPLFPWAGGKGRIINQLLEHIPPDFENYFEPFLGSGRMLFSLSPLKNIYINDLNPHLINFYTQVKNFPDKFILEFNQIISKDSKTDYLKERDKFNNTKIFDIQSAARFLFLIRTCYGGVYRVNKSGSFNGSYAKKHDYPSVTEIYALSNYLNSCSLCTISNCDFENALIKATKNDFVYMDPPYPNSKVEYTKIPFTNIDHTRVKNTLDNLTQKNTKVMISYRSNEFIKTLFSKYKIIHLKSSPSLNSKCHSRNTQKFEEIIILNY